MCALHNAFGDLRLKLFRPQAERQHHRASRQSRNYCSSLVDGPIRCKFRSRAHSSVGRALPLQGSGRGFESLCAHRSLPNLQRLTCSGHISRVRSLEVVRRLFQTPRSGPSPLRSRMIPALGCVVHAFVRLVSPGLRSPALWTLLVRGRTFCAPRWREFCACVKRAPGCRPADSPPRRAQPWLRMS